MAIRWSSYRGFSRYNISSDGKIFDVYKNRFVAQTPNEDGYLKVTLRHDSGKRKSFSVHRLVALCFIPNPKNLPEVNHLDGIKKHCYEENLEWSTHADNIQHAWDNKLLKHTKKRSANISAAFQGLLVGKHNGNSSPVYCITTKESFDCIADAVKTYNVSQPQLTKCCNGYRGAKSAGKHPVTKKPLRWRYQ